MTLSEKVRKRSGKPWTWARVDGSYDSMGEHLGDGIPEGVFAVEGRTSVDGDLNLERFSPPMRWTDLDR